MSQDSSALTTAHGPREVEWLGTRLLLRAFLQVPWGGPLFLR